MNEHIQHIIDHLELTVPAFACPPIGQTEEELKFGLGLIRLLQPKITVEIGSAAGGHVYLFSTVLNGDSEIISIDPWSSETKYGAQYEGYLACASELSKFYPHIKYSHIRSVSQSPETIRRLEEMIGDRRIDYLFIDGSHKREDIIQDFSHLSRYVSEKGIICIHDVVDASFSEAPAAWGEITASLDSRYGSRIFDRPGLLANHSGKNVHCGLGYIFIPTHLPDLVRQYLSFSNL